MGIRPYEQNSWQKIIWYPVLPSLNSFVTRNVFMLHVKFVMVKMTTLQIQIFEQLQ